ncbi:MAG: TetR/AcrR family transcriptional regulator [Saprospiraceae bacterium]|nr:TetR/AcrR family transcriptional regulator [Saprospiraceae bacterium]
METKDKILQVAFNLFLKKGYKDVSLKQIVEAVDLTKGAFYHYFSGKEELFTQVVEMYLLEGGDKIYDEIATDNLKQFLTSYIERLAIFIDKIQKEIYSETAKIEVSYFYLAFDALRLIPGFDKKMSKMHEKERDKWAEVMCNAKANNEISTNISDIQLARMFISVNDGLGMHSVLEGNFNQFFGEVFNMWNAMYNLIKT